MSVSFEEKVAMMQQAFQHIPHCAALNMAFPEVTETHCLGLVPWREDLVGNPITGTVHGGVVTTLIDSACGLAVFTAMDQMQQIATLDLRVDYLRAAEQGKTLYCRAECYKVTRKVAFARATAFTDDINDPVATANGAFMITNRGSMAKKAGGAA